MKLTDEERQKNEKMEMTMEMPSYIHCQLKVPDTLPSNFSFRSDLKQYLCRNCFQNITKELWVSSDLCSVYMINIAYLNDEALFMIWQLPD